jgi:hypothetical protein
LSSWVYPWGTSPLLLPDYPPESGLHQGHLRNIFVSKYHELKMKVTKNQRTCPRSFLSVPRLHTLAWPIDDKSLLPPFIKGGFHSW